MAISIQFEKNFKTDYTYSDLSLDMENEYTPYGESNLTRGGGNGDIKTDFDEHAIANSLRNLFSTRPKQRLLDPEYGLDLSQFLFENANEYTARLIGRKIEQGIRKYESRVTLKFVEVVVDEEYNSYDISLNLTIPSLNKDVVYRSIFTENGFTNI
jgi:phage baseplate assembly protein W